jgi:peptide chain release factor 1
MIMSFDNSLEDILKNYTSMSEKLSDPSSMSREEFIKVSKEYSDLGDIVLNINLYKKAKSEMQDLEALLDDPDMKDIAEAEIVDLKKKIPELVRVLKLSLIPKDDADEKNAILEIRAGTGGDEAALFAATLFRMYQRYAEKKGWKFEIISLTETGIGGFKEAQAVISGKNVFARLKYESGVHRVQRVPETESSGRVHTSAVTVAVLPEAEEVDIEINDKDLRIDVYRSSGAGGQHVNTTDSAVRITHIPTGVAVAQQTERSQHKNKAKAMQILRARLYDAERMRLDKERSADRKEQIGSGDRSERIRTYNFSQGRVSDHRINLTLYKIEEILNGGELDEVVDTLTADDEAKKLARTFN